MKVSSLCTCSAVMATTAAAFTAPAGPPRVRTSLAESPPRQEQDLSELIEQNTFEADEPGADARPLYDPLSMYSADAPERRADRIRPLEDAVPGNAEAAGTATMSSALPFLARPLHLDGALAGDAGFDPLGLAAASPARLVFMRDAEVRHSRLAMLAVAGWLAEELAGFRPLLQYGDRAPSVLNGGLGQALAPFFPAFAAVVVLAGVVEVFQGYSRGADPAGYAGRASGDIGFDPLGLYAARGDTAAGRRSMEKAELKHGRLAMLAITAFAAQEAVTGVGVATQVLSWLHPHSAEFLAEGGYASNVQAILSGEY